MSTSLRGMDVLTNEKIVEKVRRSGNRLTHEYCSTSDAYPPIPQSSPGAPQESIGYGERYKYIFEAAPCTIAAPT